jgi:hypothetical protein
MLDAQHGGSCAVNQNLTQVDVAALADAEQLRFTSSRVLAWHDKVFADCREHT